MKGVSAVGRNDRSSANPAELTASLACALDAGAAGDHDFELGLPARDAPEVGGERP